jgi:Glycosyl transferases group 1
VKRATVHVVLPGDVDDPAAPSGGNSYDRRLCAGLAETGWAVHRITVAGPWPWPDRQQLHELGAALDALPRDQVVLLDGLVACAAPEVLEAAADRLRLVLLIHLPLADETGLAPAQAADLDARERRAVQAAAVVVATSAAVGQRLTAEHALAAGRVHVAPPGVDPAPLTAPSPDGGRLVCVASLTPRKGHDVLVEALATLTDLPWTLVCAGPQPGGGAFADQVRRRLAGHGIADRVRLVGPLAAADLAALYAAADLLLLASRAEPYGMVVTEALACGVPVLASAVDGIPATLGRAPDGALPGLLVPPGDPAELAGALRCWLGDAAARNRLRLAAQGRRTTLTGWPDTVAAVAAALQAAGRSRGSRRAN